MYCNHGKHWQSADQRPNTIYQRCGFSLVELMVVIVIIGLLAGTVTIGVRSYLIRGKQSVAKLEISKICQAIDTFYSEFDRFPTSEEGIEILAEKTDAFPDGLLNKVPKDPWGNEYIYEVRDGSPVVICLGKDNTEGGEKESLDYQYPPAEDY